MRNILLMVASLIGSLLIFGCATTTTVKLDPAKMEYVLVYPLNDVRETKSIDLSQCGSNFIHHPVDVSYMATNFDVILKYAQTTGVKQNITYEDLIDGNTEQLKKANTSGEKYIMALYLSEYGFSSTNTFFTTSMRGFLFRVDTGEVVWQNIAKDTRPLGIVGGQINRLFGTVGNSNTCEVFGQVGAKLFSGFPKLTKRARAGD